MDSKDSNFIANKNTYKKINISFKRRITNYYTTFILIIKYMVVIFLILLLFTSKLSFIKHEIKNYLVELTGDLGFKLEKVILDGQVNMLTNDIVSLINADIGTPIFDVNIHLIKQRLEQNSWVLNAIVERRLPNTLYIGILERKPIAIWQSNKELHLIDSNGVIIKTNNIIAFSHLPHVVGRGANIHANQLILYFNSDSGLASQITAAVRHGDRRWDLLLTNNITVKMPEADFTQAWQYLVKLAQANKLFNQKYKVIDLRDPAKYYIEYYD